MSLIRRSLDHYKKIPSINFKRKIEEFSNELDKKIEKNEKLF